MALTPGIITVGTVTSNSVQLSATIPQSGTPPFDYQWYKSTVSGFTPGPGNAIAGATSRDVNVTGLIPGTVYFFVLVATEDSPSPDTAEYVQVTATTKAPTQNPNQFNMAPYLGMVDQRFPFNTINVQVDGTQPIALSTGQAVKVVDSAGGVPKVVAVTDESDEVFGFINYDGKSIAFPAGSTAQVSIQGNVIYLYATEAIARQTRVVLDLTTVGGVKQAAGATGDRIVGWAFDKATAAGQLIRVYVTTPSFEVVA